MHSHDKDFSSESDDDKPPALLEIPMVNSDETHM